MIVLGYILTYGYLLTVIAVAVLLNKAVDRYYTRKLIHIAVCFAWIIMHRCFGSGIHSVIIPFSFIFINCISYKYGIIKAMESDGKSLGTVYYVISFTVINIICMLRPSLSLCGGGAMFALSFGDGFAAMAGRNIKWKNKKIMEGRTVWGCTACLVFTAAGLFIFRVLTDMPLSFADILLLSAVSALAELVSGKYDNFVIPFAVMAAGVFLSQGVKI